MNNVGTCSKSKLWKKFKSKKNWKKRGWNKQTDGVANTGLESPHLDCYDREWKPHKWQLDGGTPK